MLDTSGVPWISRQGALGLASLKDVYRTTPGSILTSMRYCIRPVCHSHTIMKWSTLKFIDTGYLKELSWCWQTRATRLAVTQCHQTRYTVRYVGCGYLLVCYSNFVRKMNRFWDIRLQKNSNLENWLGVRRGHWKCHRSIERVSLPICSANRKWYVHCVHEKSNPLDNVR